ncbi:MAG: sugar phosphate isomerase/epimerase family protein [Planctomycetota bacterium]
MQLTFITDEATQQPREFVDLAQRFGLETLEIRTVFGKKLIDLADFELDDLTKRMKDVGLNVCCLDSDVFKCDLGDPVEIQLDNLRRFAEVAVFLGCPLVRIFTFWRNDHPAKYHREIVDRLMKAGEIASQFGVVPCIENGRRTMHCTGAELSDLFHDLDLFKVVWDPANSVFGDTDRDPLRNGYPKIEKSIAHVHLKDPIYRSEEDREYVELGKGQLGIESHLRALQASGYTGAISLETHWRTERVIAPGKLDIPGGTDFSGDGYEATVISLGYLKHLMTEIFSEETNDAV